MEIPLGATSTYGAIVNEKGSQETHQRRRLIRHLSRHGNRRMETNSQREDHLGGHRQYWRDIILGVNDGLISTYLLVVGVVASGLSPTDVLLTSISGALAGAVSMSAGEFVATKSQNEVMLGEKELERQHIEDFRAEELKEVSELLQMIGITKKHASLHQQLLDHYDRDSEALLKIMIALEFGMIDEEQRSPMAAAGTSGLLFFLGALPSVLPFVVCETTMAGLVASTVATCSCLLLVGGIKSWATRGSCIASAVENLAIAGIGGMLAYGVGRIFEVLIHKRSSAE